MRLDLASGIVAPTIIEIEASEPIVQSASTPLPVSLGATDDTVTRAEFDAAIASLRSQLFAVTQAGRTSLPGAGVRL